MPVSRIALSKVGVGRLEMGRAAYPEPSATLAVEPRPRACDPALLVLVLFIPDKRSRFDRTGYTVDGDIHDQRRQGRNGCLGLASHLLERIDIDYQCRPPRVCGVLMDCEVNLWGTG